MKNKKWAFMENVVKVWEGQRIPDSERNPELYYYELRHGDDGDWAVPVTIENRVFVNYWGTLASTETIPLGKDGYIDLSTHITYKLIEMREEHRFEK